MLIELKYRIRDKWNHPTNTWLPITAEHITGDLRYPEIVKARHAIAYNLRQEGYTWVQIGAILNKSKATVIQGAKKAEKDMIELVKELNLI